VLGLVIAVAVALLSPAIAWFYREPRLIPITIALSVSFVLSGLTIQHQALLRRAMRLKAIAFIQVTTYALAYSVAISIAWTYRTYWALVALPITVTLFRLLAVWVVAGWRPALPRREPGMRGLIGFGANLTGFSFMNYFARHADNMLIGWWWGEVPLGFYERGYKLMMAPLLQINGPLTNIMVPALSRLRWWMSFSARAGKRWGQSSVG
jgi:O-antigen/teichoic acid export membrane protein